MKEFLMIETPTIHQEDWISSFPKKVPRPQQEQAISQILQFFKTDDQLQIVLLNAPTGVGKSAIGVALARYYQLREWKTNYLVHNIYLEKQITADYPYISETMGRGRYPCIKLEKIARNLFTLLTPLLKRVKLEDLNSFISFFARNIQLELKKKDAFFCVLCKQNTPSYNVTLRNGKYGSYNLSLCTSCLSKVHFIQTGDCSCANGMCTHKERCDYSPKLENEEMSYDPKDLAYFSNRWQRDKYWVNPTHCHSAQAKTDAINNPIAIHNYDYFLNEANIAEEFSGRKLIIADEGHKIEDVLMDYVSYDVTLNRLRYYCLPSEKSKQFECPFPDGQLPKGLLPRLVNGQFDMNLNLNDALLKRWITLLKECADYMVLHSDEIESAIRKNDSIKSIIKVERFQKFVNELNTFLLDAKDASNWIIQFEKKEDNNIIIQFKPINVHLFAHRYFFKHAKKFVIMSATLLDKKMMCDSLGLGGISEKGNVLYIDMQSEFPPKNRKVYSFPIANMEYNQVTKNLPIIYNMIQKIITKHDNVKGIIHTKSNELTKAIVNNVVSDRTITHLAGDRNKVLAQFTESAYPLVLLSPSIEEGVDLKDELCRFIIILKIPYLSIKDLQIKKKMQLNHAWYAWKAIQSLIQSIGRGVRHSEDYCITYILDSRFPAFYRRWNHFFPQWIREAIEIKQ